MASFSSPSWMRMLKIWWICLEFELCQLKNGCSSPTTTGSPPFFPVIVMNLSQALSEKRLHLISIAENWINKETSRYTVVFSSLEFGNHVKNFGSNFNQDFSFLSKSNLKCLFMSDTRYWRQFNACSHKSRSQKLELSLGMRSSNKH